MRPRPRPYYGWVLVWMLGVTTVISYGTTQYLFGVLVVPIEHDLGWTRAELSGAFSLGFVVAGALGLGVGRLVDTRGARLLMTAGSLLAAACLALLSRVTRLDEFYLLWAGGIGLAMALTFYPVTFTVVTNWFARRRGSAMALLTLVGGFASVIFYPLAGALIAAYGWRTALLIMAAAQLLVAAPLHAGLLRRHPEDLGLLPDGAAPTAGPAPPPDREAGGGGWPLRAALRTGPFWTLTASAGLAASAHAVLLAHQVPYLIGRGFPPVFAAGVAGLLGVASLPARLVMNLLADRFGPRALLAVATGLQAAGTALLLVVSPGRSLLLWAFVAVYGFAFGAVSPLRASVMADQFGRRAYGAITAAVGLPVAVLAAAGPLAAGALFDGLGDYRLAFTLTAVAFGAALVCLLLTPPGVPASPPAPAPAGA